MHYNLHNVVELTLQVLVFALHGLQLIQSFFIRVLHLEQLGAKRASLFLRSLKLCLTLLILLFPLCQHLNRTINTVQSYMQQYKDTHYFLRLGHTEYCKCCHLVKVPLLLVQVSSQSIGPLYINHEVLHLTLKPLFGFLKRSALGIHCLNLLLSLLETLGQLLPV